MLRRGICYVGYLIGSGTGLFVAFMLLGVGGMGFFLASFRAAGLTESRVVFLTAASCLYDRRAVF